MRYVTDYSTTYRMAFSLPPNRPNHKHFAVFVMGTAHELHAATLQAQRFLGEPPDSTFQVQIIIEEGVYEVQIPLSKEEAQAFSEQLQSIIHQA